MATSRYLSLSLAPSSSTQLLPPKFCNFSSSFSPTANNSNICSLTGLKSKTRRRMSSLQPLSSRVATPADLVRVGEDLPDNYGDWFPKRDPKQRRRAGILLHPTSLPGPYGIGDLGGEAFRFLDWLHEAGCSVWQVLPLVPPGRKANEEGSPYSGQDANCGNTLLISLEELVKDGLLLKEELPKPMDAECVKYSTVADVKDPLLAKAAERLILSEGELKNELEDFCRDPEISGWLEDAAYFAAMDNSLNTFTWNEWPEPLKNRHLMALEEIYQSQKKFIDLFIAQQFLFQRQWRKVRNYAQKKGIKIMGDMPIYVGYHSADVWANKKLFLLNRSGFPLLVSGVPPDAFSETGQLWNSPLYDWRAMEEDGYSWWIRRIRRACNLFDEFRIDHFRGFAGYWAVPAESNIAMFGKWKAGPRKALFDAIFRAVGQIDIIAEDLGVITEDVVNLRKAIGAPGMAVLQFAFGSGSDNPHLPHNHEHDQVAYTGTHDNDTVRGWWENLKQEEKSTVLRYLSMTEEDDISWALIQLAVSSVAQTTIIPMQDILRLGSSARMNTPATQFGNWSWRIPSSVSFDHLKSEAEQLKDMLSKYGRL
ncbi:4-alpha-glucanotransferase, chloroplastic/amyloplastic isoform X2 [Telopea speciosissima]|uniref:4-alpha-glucanotransferase, chloroplastic/amyloplastic isoform X2 n=1 Tax=Telopea speciosissima TaxID=54955 RepID=UPI001CC3921F|nr:4-alpha-glucanotransferase, chloroplastic/amyloplastic isoform X2 [Telopea speciosissima]